MPVTPSPRKAISHALLGNRHKLDVLAAIAEAPPGEWVFARALADASGVRENQVGPILRRLVEAGVLVQVSFSAGGGQPILYERHGDAFWSAVTDLVDALSALPLE
jgi:DNA-binding MarR family transcriptional regulator